MKTIRNNFGFSAVEALMIVAILGVIGLIGYNIAMNTIYKDELVTNIGTIVKQQSKTATDVPQAQNINSVSDLQKAEEALDSIKLDETDADITQLDSHLSNF